MKIIKKIGKILATEISTKSPPSDKFKKNAVKFMQKHGIEVASNILGISPSKLSSWKRTYKKG